MNKGGDCFLASYHLIMEQNDLILVHGIVTGQGDLNGVRYAHAWCERGDMVLDYSNGRRLEIPKILYYAIGNILESNLYRYTHRQACGFAVETEHSGPWEDL